MPKLSVLHISDIHIGNVCYKNITDVAIRILDTLEVHNKKIDCVVVTGDVFDGKASASLDKVGEALSLFKYLQEELSLSTSDFMIVPGNHDIKRIKGSDGFDDFKKMLKEFYGDSLYQEIYDDKYLSGVKLYSQKKVAIIGLNSCMVEPCGLEQRDTEWLNELNVTKKIKNEILSILEAKKKSQWDDYGYISKMQLREVFKNLESKVDDLAKYTIVACFHHHFYPFPEIYSQYGDSSIIRNFTDVIEKFQQKNVKIVLHGHKHLPIIRPVTNHKYLTNPDSVFYVLSAGSVSRDGIINRSFQQVDVFSPESDRLAEICRFDFKKEELQVPEVFSIPPKKTYEQGSYVELIEMFKEEFGDEYQEYKREIYECDNISQQNRVDDVIKNISKAITQFESVKKKLRSSVECVRVVLYAIHYRVNYMYGKIGKDRVQNNMINKLRERFSRVFCDEECEALIVRLIEATNNDGFWKIHDELFLRYVKYQDYTALVTVSVFFTNIYLTFMKYGEFFYGTENLKHKANVKLESQLFHDNIPVSTILLSSNVDRRMVSISFKCKNPTVHKIAVLIIKEFEKLINKIEDSFRYLDLKVYYLSPKIEKDGYDLDNLNFEAYIPTLLPLLTGENLYKRKEVFIRELIQNSLDAILLRESILNKNNGVLTEEQKIIKIEIGFSKSLQVEGGRRYLRIADEGIGMDYYKIERYFTSIGRSYYRSDEFEELQKTEEIHYNPISNFGIGFLSAFMVSQEIEVTTKSYNDSTYALGIHIPNYDGCFFIKKIDPSQTAVGTSIVLYEDGRRYLNPDNIIKYIKDVFLDFQLKIIIDNKIKETVEVVESFAVRKRKNVMLFCPIIDDKLFPISWLEDVKSGVWFHKYSYGILLEFNQEASGNISKKKTRDIRSKQYLNSGILLSDSNVKDLEVDETLDVRCFYNLPSSMIRLDVAREKILSFKVKNFSKKDIISAFSSQAYELIMDAENSGAEVSLNTINNIYEFFKVNNLEKKSLKDFADCLYSLSIQDMGGYISIRFVKRFGYNPFVSVSCIGEMISAFFQMLHNIFMGNLNLINNVDYLAMIRDGVKKTYMDNEEKVYNEWFTREYMDELRRQNGDYVKNMNFNERKLLADMEHISRYYIRGLSDVYVVEGEDGFSTSNKKMIVPKELSYEMEREIKKIKKQIIDGNEAGGRNSVLDLYLKYLVMSSFKRWIAYPKEFPKQVSIMSSVFSAFYIYYEYAVRNISIAKVGDFEVKV